MTDEKMGYRCHHHQMSEEEKEAELCFSHSCGSLANIFLARNRVPKYFFVRDAERSSRKNFHPRTRRSGTQSGFCTYKLD